MAIMLIHPQSGWLESRSACCLSYNRKIVTLDFLGSLQRTQYVWRTSRGTRGAERRSDGLGQPAARPRRPHLPRSARPHRHRAGGRRREGRRRARQGRRRASGVRRRRQRPRPPPRRGPRKPQHAHRRDRSRRRRAAAAQRGEDAALLARRRRHRQRRGAPQVSLPRPAPHGDAAQLRAAQPRRHGHPQLPGRRRLPRDRDAVHDAVYAGRRARLPGPQPRPSRATSTRCRSRRRSSSRS